MNRRLVGGIVTGLVLGLIFYLNGSKDLDNRQSNEKPVIVVTTSILKDVVKNIAKDHFSVLSLMGPGVDPHLYNATEGDVRRLYQARVIFYHGHHLEAKMGDVLAQLSQSKTVLALTEKIPDSDLIFPDGLSSYPDPHIWFDVPLWQKLIPIIAQTLAKVDPVNASEYEANARVYLSKLSETQAYVLSRLETLPKEKRVLITAHDAFQYFGRAYGFTVKGLQGISTESKAGTQDVSKLADYIASKQIPAIFVESSVPERQLKAVQAAVKSRGFAVAIADPLFSDALGAEGTKEGTYIGTIRYNIDTIVTALKGGN